MFVLIVVAVIASGLKVDFSVFAQDKSERASQTESDLAMAEFIKTVTNRSDEGLIPEQNFNGGVTVDLQGRFQNVVVAKSDFENGLQSACITSLSEANNFFGKDLETGVPLPVRTKQKKLLIKQAAEHSMSVEEFLFYKEMINRAESLKNLSPNAATITIVNNDGPGEGFNDPTPTTPEGGNNGTTLGQQRLNLFNFAAGIWGAFLDSNVTILVRSQFDPLTCTPTSAVLGSAGTVTVHRDFTNAGFTGTWYHQALANKQSGTDLSTTNPDINATFNSNLNGNPGCLGGNRWYYGYDNSTPTGTINLLVVLLHEMGHGLGFSSFVNGSNGQLLLGFPDVYTTFMFDRTVSLYWNSMNNAQRQNSAINPNNVLWDGPNVKIASGFLTAGREAATGRVELYTPNPLQTGSSISHFNTAASPNLLMEPFITLGLPINLDLTRQQTRDIGWYRDTTGDLVPDTITNVTPNSGTLIIGTTATVTWTNNGGFNREVIIELSTNGGATFPVVLGSGVPNNFGSFSSFNFTVPNLPTTQGRIRVREDNFVAPAGVSSGNFAIAAPTAANVSVAGRVVDHASRAVPRAIVKLVDSQGTVFSATTNNFGYFRIENVPVGNIYTVQTSAKSLTFPTQVIEINEDILELLLVAAP